MIDAALWMRSQWHAARLFGALTVRDIYLGLQDIAGPVVPVIDPEDLLFRPVGDSEMPDVLRLIGQSPGWQRLDLPAVFDGWVRDAAYFWGFFLGPRLCATHVGFHLSPDTWMAMEHLMVDDEVPVDDLALGARVEAALARAGVRRILNPLAPGVTPRDRWRLLHEGPGGHRVFEKQRFRSGTGAMRLRRPVTAGAAWISHNGSMVSRELTADDREAAIALMLTAQAGCRFGRADAERLWRRWFTTSTILGTFAEPGRLFTLRVLERRYDGSVRERAQSQLEQIGTMAHRRSYGAFAAWLRAVGADRVMVLETREPSRLEPYVVKWGAVKVPGGFDVDIATMEHYANSKEIR